MSSKRMRDAEELKRRKMARLRFRKIIRMVSLNRLWLMSDQGDQKLSLNVKKNISMLVRPQRQIGLLTMTEKSMLRSHHSFRSIEDRKKLVLLIAGLPCFSKIPPKVCARLVPVISFMYMHEGRVIVKEGDSPFFVYFVLSGEVVVSKRVFDHMSNSYVDRMESLSGPGDCIGDIEIIENSLRRNTYTSASIVELLVLLEADFQRILYPVMATQWLDKKNALLALGYFKFFTEEQIREFEPLETIYYEDKGPVSYVHFVISGECIILQCLKMKVTQKKGKKSFELVDISQDDGGDMFQDMSNHDLLKKLRADEKERKGSNAGQETGADEEDEEEKREKRDSRLLRQMEFKRVEISCGLRQPSEDEMATEEQPMDKLDVENGENDPTTHEHQNTSQEALNESEPEQINDDQIEIVTGIGPSIEGDVTHTEEIQEKQPIQEQPHDTIEQNPEAAHEGAPAVAEERKSHHAHIEIENPEKRNTNANTNEHDITQPSRATIENTIENAHSSAPHHSEGRPSVRISTASMLMPTDSLRDSIDSPRSSSARKSKTPHSNVENRFIDVGSLTFGGIFGLGEKIEHRVVMARTTVQCLMLPRFWLFEKDQNPGNIWQRRRFYLDTTIPSRQTLFTDFLTTRKWQQFKKNLIDSCVDQSLLSNPTKVQDVPIICRIVEANDD